MTQTIPSMSRSRIDIIHILQAFRDQSSTALMSAMISFERELSAAGEEVSLSLREKKDPAALVPTYQKLIAPCIMLGATDLLNATQAAIQSHEEGSSPAAVADALAWASLAEETRTVNMALFQVSQLFGRALNGKLLPDRVEDITS